VPQSEEPEDPDLSAWRQIVENYGERAELPPDAQETTEPTEWSAPATAGQVDAVALTDLPSGFDDDVDQPFDAYDDPAAPVDERFVPPEPEPLHLGPARTAAWAGVLGAPLAALVATIVVTATGVSVPHWFGWLLVAAFLGGFGYLVVTMPKDRDDPWDDGARL
jgi:hypothetical protein